MNIIGTGVAPAGGATGKSYPTSRSARLMDGVDLTERLDELLCRATWCAGGRENAPFAACDPMRGRGQLAHRRGRDDDRAMAIGMRDIARAHPHAQHFDRTA